LEKQSVNQRISQAEQAIDLISANPVLGTGFNNYTLRLKQLFPQAPAFDLQPVHNIYLLLAGETGLVGLILFLLAIFAILWLAIKRGGWINLSLPLTLLIIGLFDHYLLTQYIGLAMLWLSLTFALTIAKIDKNSEL
jgi:O-antigen ligase